MAKELISLEVKGAWMDDHLLVPTGAGAGKEQAEAMMSGCVEGVHVGGDPLIAARVR